MPQRPPRVSVPWLPHWPVLVPVGKLPGPDPEITRPFWMLYDAVTDMIRERSTSWTPPDDLFVEYLIAGFFKYYEEWKQRPELLSYLSLFHQESAYRALQLIGQAYLHMAYDLPRTIANAYSEFPGIDRSRTTANYLSLESGFVQVAEQTFRRREIVGLFAFIGASRHSRRTAAGNFCFWMKNIRSNALHHAGILHNPPGGMSRKSLEQNLIEEIQAAAEEVLRRSWNPLCWLPALSSPSILVVLPPVVLFAQIDVGINLSLVAIGITVLAIVLLASSVILNRALVRMTEALGVAISRAAWRAVGSLRSPENTGESTPI
jgi:hypothetical protein